MCEEEINEGNKLIAEFIGLEKNDFGHWINKDYLFNSQLKLLDFELKFHSSWDWLIPCINKIYESDWYYKWKDTSGQFEKEIFINTKFIEVTWEQVVEFIKWYNLCQKEK